MELLKRTIHRNDVRQEGQLQTILEEDVNLPETKPDVGTICMERGRIVEQGTHAALLAAGGLYARLHQHSGEAALQ